MTTHGTYQNTYSAVEAAHQHETPIPPTTENVDNIKQRQARERVVA